MLSHSLRKLDYAIAKSSIYVAQRYNFGRRLEEPSDPVGIDEMKVNVGDYAQFERTFNDVDLQKFSEAIQDNHAHHIYPDAKLTFFRPDIVYGIFSSTTFTTMFRGYFPKCIYMSQEVKFRVPIVHDEVVTAKVEITGWEPVKKNVHFKTTITKVVDGKDVIAVEGKALLRVPYITVSEKAE